MSLDATYLCHIINSTASLSPRHQLCHIIISVASTAMSSFLPCHHFGRPSWWHGVHCHVIAFATSSYVTKCPTLRNRGSGAHVILILSRGPLASWHVWWHHAHVGSTTCHLHQNVPHNCLSSAILLKHKTQRNGSDLGLDTHIYLQAYIHTCTFIIHTHIHTHIYTYIPS